jgi:hypothetical protein
MKNKPVAAVQRHSHPHLHEEEKQNKTQDGCGER